MTDNPLRLVAGQHRAWRHCRQGGRSGRAQVGTPTRLRRRRVVPAASTAGPPAADGQEPVGRRQRHGRPHVWHVDRRPEAVRRRHQGHHRQLPVGPPRLQPPGPHRLPGRLRHPVLRRAEQDQQVDNKSLIRREGEHCCRQSCPDGQKGLIVPYYLSYYSNGVSPRLSVHS